MVRESNVNVFLIQIDASCFTEFELSEFKIFRFDCIVSATINKRCTEKNGGIYLIRCNSIKPTFMHSSVGEKLIPLSHYD